jgi:hypothetical protein
VHLYIEVDFGCIGTAYMPVGYILTYNSCGASLLVLIYENRPLLRIPPGVERKWSPQAPPEHFDLPFLLLR